MQRLGLAEFRDQAELFDRALLLTPGIDQFCSSSDWILPAAAGLMPPREPWIHAADGHYWAFMRGETAEGIGYLEALENMWGLACPTIGSSAEELADGVAQLCKAPSSAWSVMALSGLAAGSDLFLQLIADLAEQYRLGLGPTTSRLIVDLEEGVDAFLSRRSKQFRRSLERSERDARARGISIVDASTQEPISLFQRILDVEFRGWKGQSEVGIGEGGMRDFYEQMLPRLHRRGAQRVLFAQHEGRDVAYIFGGLLEGNYRGLQFSFDDAYRKFGLGNLLQLEQIRRLCDESILAYDLGTHMDYKLRWADRHHETVTLLLMR
jgi:hypothetical protein